MSKSFPLSDGVRREYQRHQAEADGIYRQLGEPSAPPPLDNEWLPHYRRRLLEPLKQHSPTWAKVEIPNQEDVLAVAERQIYADAAREARAPTNLRPGELVERIVTDSTGRKISKFFGDPAVTWGPFSIPPKLVIGFGGAGK